VKVLNIHQRELNVTPDRVGALIDTLSSHDDLLSPKQAWLALILDRPLGVGAAGGHGPIRYVVEAYTPGRCVRFRFTGPAGFNGHHRYEVIDSEPQRCVLRHTLEMTTSGRASLMWPVAWRHMHNALIEDSLALAQAAVAQPPQVQKWSAWVRLLRWFVSKGAARTQAALPLSIPA
jgi:hypothetical protein